MVKLNNKGFSYHLVLPILALFLVGSIGAFMTLRSNAAVPVEGWKTIKTNTGAWSVPRYGSGVVKLGPGIAANGRSKYRVCVVVKASTNTGNRLGLNVAKNINSEVSTSFNVSSYIGKSYKTVCSTSLKYPSGNNYAHGSTMKGSTGKLTVSKVFWQRYY